MTDEERKRLEDAAGVSFPIAEAEVLVGEIKNYFEDRGIRRSDRLRKLLKLRQQVRDLGGEVTHPKLKYHDNYALMREVTDRQWPQYLLCCYVEAIKEAWRIRGGKGEGSYYSDPKGHHDGPLIRLLLELFRQAGIPENLWPSRHTLHKAIDKSPDEFPSDSER